MQKADAMSAELPDSPSDQVMRRLWLRMTEIYGHRWTSAYGEDAEQGAGSTWAQGLAGLSSRDIATGLRAALLSTNPWPPTLPQFRAMCLDVPTLPAVILALTTRTVVTPFMRLVWTYVDGFRLRTADADKGERLIRDAYELAREHVMAGGALPPEPAALLEQQQEVRKPADPLVAEKHLADIAAMLHIADAAGTQADGTEVQA